MEVCGVIRSARRALPVTAVILASCSVPASLDWVPGTYVMNRGRAADTLVVRANHSYERRYAMPGAAAVIDHGAWSVDTIEEHRYVTFEPFVARWKAETDPTGTAPTSGFWPVQPERTMTGAIVLNVNSDLGWEYRRISVVY